MPRVRHTPLRMCLNCGERRPKRELLRIVRTPDGEVVVDADERVSGRGCYICPDSSKTDAKRIRDKIKRALNFQGELPAELIADLEVRAKQT